MQPTLNTTFFDLAVRGTSTFHTIGGYANSVTTDGGASWTAENVHVQGGLTFAAGPGKVRMDGGRFMGALSDPGNKFVRNVGQ